MRLNRLRLSNFRLHADTRIDFESGLTGIIGPNGSGKTTILEAIAWALYGTPAVRGTKEGIRWLRAPARASVRVELDFDLAGHRYHVTRTLSSAEVYLDGAASPIANTVSGVTDLLRRRLGMTQQEFFNTYFTGQKELSVMAKMGPAERAQFLSRVLGYERLRGAQSLVRERRNLIKAELGVHKELASQLHQMETLFQEEGRRRALIQNRQLLDEELKRLRERLARVETAVADEARAAAQQSLTRGELEAVSAQVEAA